MEYTLYSGSVINGVGRRYHNNSGYDRHPVSNCSILKGANGEVEPEGIDLSEHLKEQSKDTAGVRIDTTQPYLFYRYKKNDYNHGTDTPPYLTPWRGLTLNTKLTISQILLKWLLVDSPYRYLIARSDSYYDLDFYHVLWLDDFLHNTRHRLSRPARETHGKNRRSCARSYLMLQDEYRHVGRFYDSLIFHVMPVINGHVFTWNSLSFYIDVDDDFAREEMSSTALVDKIDLVKNLENIAPTKEGLYSWITGYLVKYIIYGQTSFDLGGTSAITARWID